MSSLGEYIVIFIIVIISNLICDLLRSYINEKGKNFATKEDIGEITRKVEDIKNLVSFTAQKRFEHLNEQERILIEILQVATQISQSQNKLILYLYDTTSRNRYDLLVDFVNDKLAYLYHLNNLAIITINEEGIEDIIKRLSMSTTYLGLEICTLATNAANLVSQYNNEMDYALNKTNNEQEKAQWLSSAIRVKLNIEDMRKKSLEGKDKLSKAIEDYCLWLKQLYGKDFFIYKSSN